MHQAVWSALGKAHPHTNRRRSRSHQPHADPTMPLLRAVASKKDQYEQSTYMEYMSVRRLTEGWPSVAVEEPAEFECVADEISKEISTGSPAQE